MISPHTSKNPEEVSAVEQKRSLRAVQPGEKPEPKPVFASISEAIEAGSSRDVLASMRKQLASKLDADEVSSNALTSAYKELRELDTLIRRADAEAAAEEVKHGDELGQRRSFNAAAI